MGHKGKNGSHLENLVKLAKINHREKWVTLGENESHLEKWVTLRKVSQT